MDDLLHGVLYFGEEEEEEEEEGAEDDDLEDSDDSDDPGDDEVDEDELKETVAEKFGLDPEKDKELLEKLVNNEKDHHKKLSGAIKQKINWRKKFNDTKSNPKKTDKGNTPKPGETPDVNKLVSQGINEALEARDLEELDLSDELKAEVKTLAKAKGISVRVAAKDPYIQFRKKEYEEQERIKQATPKRSNKGGYTPNVDPSKPLDVKNFNLSTPEGRKAWEDAKAARHQHLAENK